MRDGPGWLIDFANVSTSEEVFWLRRLCVTPRNMFNAVDEADDNNFMQYMERVPHTLQSFTGLGNCNSVHIKASSS